MQVITSQHNPRLKAALRLREPRGRKQQGRIIIDGVREIDRALDAGWRFQDLFVCPSICDKAAGPVLDRAVAVTESACEVTAEVFARLAFGDRAEGMVAVAEMPESGLHRLKFGPEALIAVLEAVEKPGNLGAVLRTADAAGIAAVIVADSRVELYNPNVIRASLGAIFTVPVAVASGIECRDWLRAGGFRVLASRVGGSESYTRVSYRGRCAVVLGSEAEGLSAIWGGNDVTAISLPMHGRIDSLNVSNTAAILFYEALRQRSP